MTAPRRAAQIVDCDRDGMTDVAKRLRPLRTAQVPHSCGCDTFEDIFRHSMTRLGEKKMQGLFVDSTHCMRVVTPEGIVYAASKGDGWMGTVRPSTSKHWITLKTPHHTHVGAFDGVDCVVWENGDKWHRLCISFAQWELLTHRRYTPLTVVFAAYVYAAARAAFRRVAAMCAR